MGLITRPNKTASGTRDFANTSLIKASELNGDADTIYDEFNGNVDAANLKNSAVTTAKINDAAVTTAKIADANVTLAKMASNSVDANKLVDGAVTKAKVGAAAVSLDKLDNVIYTAILDSGNLPRTSIRTTHTPTGTGTPFLVSAYHVASAYLKITGTGNIGTISSLAVPRESTDASPVWIFECSAAYGGSSGTPITTTLVVTLVKKT